jgi:hypothetical protein
MMTRLMLNLRDPQLNGVVEEFKATTTDIGGFNRHVRSGTIGGHSGNVEGA